MEQKDIDEIIESLSCNKKFINMVAEEVRKQIEAKQAYLDRYKAGQQCKRLEKMELTETDLICAAQHLVAQHRQNAFKRVANIMEACNDCPIFHKCYGKESNMSAIMWHYTYPKICKAAGVKPGLKRGIYPLEPYNKEDN